MGPDFLWFLGSDFLQFFGRNLWVFFGLNYLDKNWTLNIVWIIQTRVCNPLNILTILTEMQKIRQVSRQQVALLLKRLQFCNCCFFPRKMLPFYFCSLKAKMTGRHQLFCTSQLLSTFEFFTTLLKCTQVNGCWQSEQRRRRGGISKLSTFLINANFQIKSNFWNKLVGKINSSDTALRKKCVCCVIDWTWYSTFLSINIIWIKNWTFNQVY